MGKRKKCKKAKKKKPIQWRELTITALIDLIIGVALILVEKLFD